MIIILFIQILLFMYLLCLLHFKHLFKNLFYVTLTGVTLAFIPNFITSLFLSKELINIQEGQILFSITGSTVIFFLYKLLYNIKL